MSPAEFTLDKTDPAYAGQAAYSRPALWVYDLVAYKIDVPFFWRCSVKRLLATYDEHVSACHLDVGVGTGYLLRHCRFPTPQPQITLMDLNPNPLAFAARRLRCYAPRTHRANLLAPWGFAGESFDSIAMCNVLNCAPGTLSQKAVAFDYALQALAPGGCLFGATVLNGGVEQTRRSRLALKRLNGRGVFDNLNDHLDDLEAALAPRFTSHEITVEGSMAFFVAWVGAAKNTMEGGSENDS